MSNKRKKELLFSSSDSDDDLDRELAAAIALENKKNPHAVEGRAVKPKEYPLQHHAATSKRLQKNDLFASESDNETSSGDTKVVVNADVAAEACPDNKKGKKPYKYDGLHVNRQYATRFEEVKRKQELQKLTEKYGKKLATLRYEDSNEDDSEGTDSEEEDDEAVLLTAENDLAFAKALLAVKRASANAKTDEDGKKSRESESYLRERYFPSPEEQIQRNTELFEKAIERKRQEKRQGKFTLADEYKRKVETTAKGVEDEADAADGCIKDNSGLRKLKPQSAEERALRTSFLKSVGESTEDFEIKQKAATAPHASDEVDNDEKLREERGKILQQAFAMKSEEGEDGNDEVFIRDFFTKELWRADISDDDDAQDDGKGRNHFAKTLAELAQAEEDEAFFNDVDAWERDFQEKKYRHEEEAESANHVQTFPRTLGEDAAGLLRKQSTARKDARMRRLERTEAIRALQVEELKRLKHLKRQEIDEQRALIATVAGLTVGKQHRKGGDNLAKPTFSDEDEALTKLQSVWTESDLNAPFDPAEFDKKMAQLFDDDYYKEENVDEAEMAYFEAELDEGSDDDLALPGSDNEEADDADPDTATAPRQPQSTKAKQRSRYNAVADDPELFHVDSLEAAKAHGHKVEAVEDTTHMLVDPFTPSTNGEDIALDEDMALLYPSKALRHLEEETFRKKQQLDHLLAATSPGKKETDSNNQKLIEKLHADLKQKEEEYYKLHHEDTIAGGEIKTRFRYRSVPAEDFTLSVEEILARDDRQLNMIAPMNCYAAYLDRDSNLRDRRRIENRCRKGFREVDSERTSRRYKNVARTAIFDDNMTEEEGIALAKQIRKRLREDGEPSGPVEDVDAEVAQIRAVESSQLRHPPSERRGSGRGGHFRPENPGRRHHDSRGRGGMGGFRGGRGHDHRVPPAAGGQRGGFRGRR